MEDGGRNRRMQSTILRATSPELAAGRRVGVCRGSRSCRCENAGGDLHLPPSVQRASGEKKRMSAGTNTEGSKSSGANNLPILTRSNRPCEGAVEDQNSHSCFGDPHFYSHHQVLIAGYLCHQITCRVCFTSLSFAKVVIRMKAECHHGVALNFTATLMQSSSSRYGVGIHLSRERARDQDHRPLVRVESGLQKSRPSDSCPR